MFDPPQAILPVFTISQGHIPGGAYERVVEVLIMMCFGESKRLPVIPLALQAHRGPE